jgi:hypothetical protein
MTRVHRRPLFAFTLGAALAAAVLLGHAAYATDGAIEACFKPSNGTLYLLGEGSGRTVCQPGDIPISWNAAGLNGQDGEDGQDGISVTSEQLAPDDDAACPTGGSKFTSASGVTYACNGADGQDGEDGEDFAGTFTSPNGLFTLSIDNSGAKIDGPASSVYILPGSVQIQGTGSVQVSGGSVILGSGPCGPAARTGDLVQVDTSAGIGPIIGGSTTVCIG